MKQLILILSILFLAFNAFATTALYRISSGEVYVLSITDDMFPVRGSGFNSVAVGVSTPDGVETLSPNDDLRVFGYAKILDGTIVRNATQEEIDGFAAYETAGRNTKQAALARKLFETDAKFRRAFIAIIRGVVREDNQNRDWIRTFMDAVAASTSLGDFQSRVAALDYPVDRELQDAIDYIKDQISADD